MGINDLKSFDLGQYSHIDLDRLVMFAAVKLDDMDVELSLENIIVGSFRLFPEKFSLFGYSEYPDATRVEKSLWRCNKKNRRWIGGKTKLGYEVVDRTRVIADKIAHQLSVPAFQQNETKTIASRRRKESIIKEMESSTAYVKYLNGHIDEISNSDFCYLLQGTLDSSVDTLKGNLDALKNIIGEIQRDDLNEFIVELEEKFQDFLNK